ncbi:MAG TPA: tRNA pseudouridine(55) synthase TruB [Firmicutes bacterium]|nr:tRNA pseudouridine(55) synthase TruB [Bacillota bacterium]
MKRMEPIQKGTCEDIDGILVVLKPPGMTSHDVIAWLRGVLKIRRIGHTGTLDPLAAGVLPVLIGGATRVAQFMATGYKKYRAEILLGVSTDTLDSSGRVTRVVPEFRIDRSTLERVLSSFTGRISQVPPMVSAVHYEGRRLYELAREGRIVERKPREVEVREIKVVGFRGPAGTASKGDASQGMDGDLDPGAPELVFGSRVIVDIECSSGTYIRSLASDIGDALGTGAHLSFLVRTLACGFALTDAATLEEIKESVDRLGRPGMLLPVASGLRHIPEVTLAGEDVMRVQNGASVIVAGLHHYESGSLVRLHAPDPDASLVAIAKVVAAGEGIVARPIRVFPDAGRIGCRGFDHRS